MSQRSTHSFASIAAAICLIGLANGCSDPSGKAVSFPPKGSSCITGAGGLICTNWTCVHKIGDVAFCTSKQPQGVPLPVGKYPCTSSNAGFYCPPGDVDVGGGAPDCKATPDLLACKMPAANPPAGTAGSGGSSGEGSDGVAGSETGTGGIGLGSGGVGGDGTDPVDEGTGSGGAGANAGTGGSNQGTGTGGSNQGTGTGGSNQGTGTGGSNQGTGTGGSNEGSGTGGSNQGSGTGGSNQGTGTGGSAGGSGGAGPDAGAGTGGCGGSASTGTGGSAGGEGTGGSNGNGGSGGAGGGENLGCTRTQGYWKTHAGAWPVGSLVVGQVTYSKDELIDLFMTESQGDASLILGHQLFAALLNQSAGAAVPAQITNALSAAQLWMETHQDADARLPYGVSPASPDGSAAVALGSVLDEFNNGLAGTPHCR